jgi:hypothetical protein
MMQDRLLLNSPMPNPLIIMMTSPHMCGQTTATTYKQFCSGEGFSDRKFFHAFELVGNNRSPHAVRNFAYPEMVQKHFQNNQDELINSFDKSPEMASQMHPLMVEG